MKRVLIAESIDQDVLAEFTGRGVEFVYSPNLTPEELENQIAGFDGLIVRPKIVSDKVIQAADKLKLIIRGGAGVNSIAVEACKQKGIIVANTPGLNSDATAEFTILMMFKVFAKRQAEFSNALTRKGNPGLPENYMGFELKGKRLGLVGLGNIAIRVATIASGFGMDVVAYSRSKKDLPIRQVHSLEKLLSSECDIISLHVPLSNETEGMLGKHEFAIMKPGTILINTARPQLISITAFNDALASGEISGFAIDGDYDLVEPFIRADTKNLGIITHHIADATYEAQANITHQALDQAISYFVEGKILNRVA